VVLWGTPFRLQLPFRQLRGLAALILLLASALHAQTLQGNLDSTNSNTCTVAGWARDPQTTDPIQVQIYADGDSTTGNLVTTVTASLLRTDLPYPDQNHGFSQTLPSLIDGQIHAINAYAVGIDGTTKVLNGPGKTLQCFQHASVTFVASPSSQVTANDTMQLTATVYDVYGNPVPSAPITWSVSDKTALSIDANGLVTAIGLGWSDVYADTPGVRGTVRLQVVPLRIDVHPANQTVHIGDTVQYSADVLDVNGQPISGVTLGWRAFGESSGSDNGVGIDQTGQAFTFGFGTFFIEAYFNYTVGGGPFIQRFYGNTLLTVGEVKSFTQTKLLDTSAVRQTFQLRERRGLLSVNDSGQVAYVGWLEGFATAALMWSNGALTPVAVASFPAELPGSNLIDINDPALNNNGEIATQCIVISPRGCILFGGRDGTSHMILFDGVTGGGVTNIRNFQVTRFALNDNSLTVFRGDYQNLGSATTLTGLFTTMSNGLLTLQVPAGTNLPGLGTTYTFDRDFGIDNNGNILFYATNGTARALYRMNIADLNIVRVIGTGDMVNGSPVVSLGNVAVGKNGQFATMVNNGTSIALLFNGSATQYSQLTVGYVNTIYAVGPAGDIVFVNNVSLGNGLFRWNGSTLKTVFLLGAPSPTGDLYTQFDSAGFTAKGEVIAQARTANNLLVVVNSGAGAGAKPSILFQTGTPVNAPAGPAFYNLVLNGHTGNPMIKTGWYTADVFEMSSGSLLPRLTNGDRLPSGWFYEGNQDVRRNADGDLFVSTDQSITQIGAGGTTMLAHFPQRGGGGNLNTAFQVVANTSGAVVIAGGTNFGPQYLSVVKNGTANVIAWLGTNATYRTAAPGGGYFLSSNDIAVDDTATVYANLNVTGGPNGLFTWTAQGGWSSLLKIGDTFDGRNVTSIDSIRATGTSCYAHITTTGNVAQISQYQNGQWTDLVSYTNAIPAGNILTSISSAFDVNRKGGLAVLVGSFNGIQYLEYIVGSNVYVVADNNHPMPSGELAVTFFQVSVNDDGRIFATAINDQDQMVLYEFDPVF
jgi:hypothetical protein